MCSLKKCFMPNCRNSNENENENKHFFPLPRDFKIRKLWWQFAGLSLNTLSFTSAYLYCCEEHFKIPEDFENWGYAKFAGVRPNLKKGVLPRVNFEISSNVSTCAKRPNSDSDEKLEHDMENYMEWKMMGVQKRMKKNVVPHIFACQENRKLSCSRPTRKVPERRAKQRIIQDLLCEPGTSKAGVKVEQKISTEPESIKKNRKISKGVQANRRKKYRTKSTQYFGHESSQFIPIAPKKPNNDMANYTDFRFTHQNTMERTLNTSVGTCTTYSSTDQMQQTNMSESCEPLLEVYVKEEKLDEIIPCDLCLDVFCSMENLMRHVNDKHMKIEINEEPLEKKIKQENDVEDDIHMNDDSFRVEIKEEIIDQIKKEETEQIEEDIS